MGKVGEFKVIEGGTRIGKVMEGEDEAVGGQGYFLG